MTLAPSTLASEGVVQYSIKAPLVPLVMMITLLTIAWLGYEPLVAVLLTIAWLKPCKVCSSHT